MIYPQKRCKYCKGLFTPTQKHQAFCKVAHRDSYWRHGALPFDKLIERMEKYCDKRMREIAREELAALAAEARGNAG